MPSTFNRVRSSEQIQRIEAMAEEIWTKHYVSIITEEQIKYMLDRYQSVPSITDQIENKGYEYYIVRAEDEDVGYVATKTDGDQLFLSKFYIREIHRGKGYASGAVNFLVRIGEERNLRSIGLTVNCNNHGAIAVYEKKGFQPIRTQVIDIGNGFVMDDIVMEKSLR